MDHIEHNKTFQRLKTLVDRQSTYRDLPPNDSLKSLVSNIEAVQQMTSMEDFAPIMMLLEEVRVPLHTEYKDNFQQLQLLVDQHPVYRNLPPNDSMHSLVSNTSEMHQWTSWEGLSPIRELLGKVQVYKNTRHLILCWEQREENVDVD